ncbi:MAG TPA: hypothetical protein VKQ11_03730 [Candidatus Sulfotelmatobacter sp.]|nr:hypothetical protein [Candidatus Sulfotelmatobacter sp.]
MTLDDDAREVSDECWRIKGDRLVPGDFERLADELGMDEEDWQRLCVLLDRSRIDGGDEDLLANWHTVKEEIIGGCVYGFVRANFPDLSHELLALADFGTRAAVVSVANENDLAGVPFTFNSKLADELVHRIRLFAGDSETLEREIRMTLRTERRRRMTRPAILALIAIALMVVALWKLL